MNQELKDLLDKYEDACWTSPSEAPAIRQRIETLFASIEAKYDEAKKMRNALVRQFAARGVPQ